MFMKKWALSIALAAAFAVGCGDDDDAVDGGADSGADTDTLADAGADAGADTDYEPVAIEPPWFPCAENDEPAGATVLTAFDLADQFFDTDPALDCKTIDSVVEFPTTGEWQRIDMKIDLTCPADGDCDDYDRFANVMLVENPGDAEETFELERYITPFNVGMCMLTDVTRFAPRLKGTKTIRSWIDTWVGPNAQSNYGHGWRVTIKFIFHPGAAPEGLPTQVVNVWSYESVIVGDPSNQPIDQIDNKTVEIPAGTTKAELRVVTTGHGQGNANNCAEFCTLSQVILVDSVPYSYDLWRDDCDDNPIGPTQAGTWQYDRAGWCPGAYVLPTVLDITGDVTAGVDSTLEYQVWDSSDEIYENTCRPDAGVDGVCEGCVFDSEEGNCEYNGGLHTVPSDSVPVQLVLY